MIKNIFKLLRIKHYIKNLLIFIPMFFGGVLFDINKIRVAFLGFITFSLVSSIIYIINDYKDIEKDKMHPNKKNRPLASGAISKSSALYLIIFCLLLAIIISVYIGSIYGSICLLIYFILNILYSFGLKRMPIIDVVILASGFVIRVFYGGIITNISISKWLYLVVITGSLYMGLGKRRNELKSQTDTRDVLKYYSEGFLDKNMYVCVSLVNVFYALWSIEMPNTKMIWTVPFLMIILLYYSLNIEGESDGDPVELIVHDKKLISAVLLYGLVIFLMLYVF